MLSMQDVHMPVMGGLEAAQHIRKYEEVINDTVRTQQGTAGPDDVNFCRRKRRIPIIAVRSLWHISNVTISQSSLLNHTFGPCSFYF